MAARCQAWFGPLSPPAVHSVVSHWPHALYKYHLSNTNSFRLRWSGPLCCPQSVPGSQTLKFCACVCVRVCVGGAGGGGGLGGGGGRGGNQPVARWTETGYSVLS